MENPKYSTLNHSVLKSIEWVPENPAEQINDHILMSRSTSNSYLIHSQEGDVVINTGTPYQGVRTRERFEELLGRPLNVKKIIFTQSHPDHLGGWSAFADAGVETISQRAYPQVTSERKMMAQYFQPRALKVLSNMTPKKEHVAAWYQNTEEPGPMTYFADQHRFQLGDRSFELISTPSGETLDSLIVWLPEERTVFTGNLFGAIQGALPNFYTARGDRDRSVARFFTDIEQVMSLRPTMLITGHDEPIIGEDEVQIYLTKLRDMVRYLHDETIKGMSEHKELWQLMQEITLPENLQPTHGRSPVPWYIRTIWEEYTGWFRAELTSELYATPSKAIWPELAELAGGVAPLLDMAWKHLNQNDAEKALHFVEIARVAEPENRDVRTAEIAVLKMLIDNNKGKHYDELGWLESALSEAVKACQA